MKSLNRGYNFTTAIAIAGFFFACLFLLKPTDAIDAPPYVWLWFFGCGLIGIFCAVLPVFGAKG